MTEKKSFNFENLQPAQTEDNQAEKHTRPLINQAELESRQSSELKAARKEIDNQADSVEKAKVIEKLKSEETLSSEQDHSKLPASKELKKQTLNKEMKHIRRKLNPSDRLVSQIIHLPAIKNVLEGSSKTITRPSGLLGGGITAFIGTSIYLYFTKYVGLKYNYTMFLLLLIAGFILGLIIEAVIRLFRGSKTV